MKYLLPAVCVLVFFAGCKKHSDTIESSGIHLFNGIVVTNEVGQPLGTWGTEDGDWKTDANWTSAEYDLLNFPDTISLDGTYIEDTTGWNIGPGIHEQPNNFVALFPNPVYNDAMMVFRDFGVVKCKVVLVDKYYKPLETFSFKWNGLVHHLVDLSDSIKYQNGVYRIFYSYSVKDSLNFYKGHGDILICRDHSWQYCKSLVP